MYRTYSPGGTVVLLLILTISAPAQKRATPEAGEGFDNQVCRTTGTARHQVKVCISKNGNVHTLARPANVDHMTSEGYAVCYYPSSGGEKIAWDDAYASSGWGPATASGTAFPLTITRTTVDGLLRLTQKFTWDAVEKKVGMEILVKNLTNSTLDYTFARFFDADIQDTFWDDTFTRTGLSVIADEPDPKFSVGSPGIALVVLNGLTDNGVFYYPINPTVCFGDNRLDTPVQGDLIGRVIASGPTALPPFGSYTLKLHYQVY